MTTDCGHDDDCGAVAVEMAIVTPLLLLMIFGTLQYGWLFHQMDSAKATARDAAVIAAAGVDDCNTFAAKVRADATGNDAPTPWRMNLTIHDGLALVDLTFTPIAMAPLVPFPATVTEHGAAPTPRSSQDPQVTTCQDVAS